MWGFFESDTLNPLAAVPIIVGFSFSHQHIKFQLMNMLMIKRDMNQQDFKIINLHFVKYE